MSMDKPTNCEEVRSGIKISKSAKAAIALGAFAFAAALYGAGGHDGPDGNDAYGRGPSTPGGQVSGTQGNSSGAKDPGVRADKVDAGYALPGLTGAQMDFFEDGLGRFLATDSVSGTIAGESNGGLGPGFNSNSCGSCHAQPAPGGTSPSASEYPNIGANPQIAAASDAGGTNSIPFFISADSPVREARFPFVVSNGQVTSTPDGGVHDLFTIVGRTDAPTCTNFPQPNFSQMEQLNNLIFRIPTPTYGAGLIENIPDATILANMGPNAALKRQLGISGHPNYSGNDGTITRFGWKAQNKSLVIFSGEAYNVEMGVTNEAFPDERNTPPPGCLINPTPEDTTNFSASGAAIASDVVAFSDFMRLLAPPTPSAEGIPGNPPGQSLQNGQAVFHQIHCDLCHTPALQTGASSITAALNNQTAALFSDLIVHHMGANLADRVSQGSAGPDEFRTAPLWGVGQRIFFLHDGRATPANGGLVRAIQDHAGPGSEANQVVSLFDSLSERQQQDLLNYLRSL